MAQAPKARSQSTQQVINTANRNISAAEKAGLLPASKPRKAVKPKAAAKGRKPRGAKTNGANTPMVKRVRKIERTTAMY